MLALSLETAKTVALVAAAAFLVVAVASAWLVRSIAAKVVTMVVLAGLAVVIWSQRTNLVECAERAEDRITAGTTSVTCTFFGTDVVITD